uniref:Migration and invasion inhibitory protein n=1 Tax=Salvator merianae TaxID=96440 RepID=A0A8D0CC61_SALMN
MSVSPVLKQQVKLPAKIIIIIMELELARLRQLNQDLLQKLKANQEAFQRQTQIKHLFATPPSGKATPQRTSENLEWKAGQDQFLKDMMNPTLATLPERGQQATQPGLGSPSKFATRCDAEKSKMCHQGHLHPAHSEISFVGSATTACKTVRSFLGAQANPYFPVRDTEAENRSDLISILEAKVPNDGRKKAGRTPEEGKKRPNSRARMLNTPKSILLTPQGKEANEKHKKEAAHVTFNSEPEEYTLSADDWSIRPFLGYDWIAGLLDMDSSLSEKSEQYFSELQDFRRVNREDCIDEQDLESDMPGSAAYNREQDTDTASHQCVYCYRLNKRLFAMPVDPKSACPICKNPRTQRPPETLVEPAFVRVSIPRSTLLPPYKHRIHRRKSYEPADNLGLPSHCLSGWENSLRAVRPTFSSLDLFSSLETQPLDHSSWKSASRVSGGAKTDELLDISRAAEFELSNVSQQQKPLFCKTTPGVKH